jgi:hypothetical protein
MKMIQLSQISILEKHKIDKDILLDIDNILLWN